MAMRDGSSGHDYLTIEWHKSRDLLIREPLYFYREMPCILELALLLRVL